MAPTALSYGTAEQKQRLLPPMARSEVVWCQGYSEPGAGSDLAAISTRAERDGDEWVVTGQKIWTTFAHHADWIFAIVRTEPGSTRHAGLSYMLIPLDQPGVTIVPIRTMLGDSGFNEVFFDGRTHVVRQRARRRGQRMVRGDDDAGPRTRHLGAQLPVLVPPGDEPASTNSRNTAARSTTRSCATNWSTPTSGLQIMAYNNLRSLSARCATASSAPRRRSASTTGRSGTSSSAKSPWTCSGPTPCSVPSGQTGPDAASEAVRRDVHPRAGRDHLCRNQRDPEEHHQRARARTAAGTQEVGVSGPLDWVRVLDLSRILAAPLTSQLLADMGADVIKVERPGVGDDARQYGPPFLGDPGDNQSGFYLSANRNKRSITVDHSTPEGADRDRGTRGAVGRVHRELPQSACSRSTASTIGSLRAHNPRLVYCSVTGFGQTGPYAQRAGYDGVFQAMSGMMSVSGVPDGAARRGTDEGRRVDGGRADRVCTRRRRSSRHCITATWSAAQGNSSIWRCSTAGWPRCRTTCRTTSSPARRRRAGATAGSAESRPRRSRCADDEIFVVASTARQWTGLVTALGRPELASDPRFATVSARIANRDLVLDTLNDDLRRAARPPIGSAGWRPRTSP